MILIKLLEYLNKTLINDNYIYWVNDKNFFEKIEFEKIKIDENFFLKLIYKVNEVDFHKIFWEEIIYYISPECITKSVFKYFLDNEISLVTLAHMDLDDRYLIKLFPYDNKAVFTVYKRYYKNEKYSVHDFSKLLINYFNPLLLNQLIIEEPNDSKKEMILLYYCKNFNELNEKVNCILKSKILKVTSDLKQIEDAYKENNYIFNIAISSNLNTSNEILDSLSTIKNIKYASIIRNNSIETKIIKNILKPN